MKVNFNKVLRNLSKWATKHQPELLQAMGFAAGASALVLTATGTVKTVREIDEKEIEKPLTKKEKVAVAAKHYIPATLAAGMSVACHIGASKVYIKRNAMLASWGTMMYDKLNKLEEKNVEVLGEKKAQKIQDELAIDEMRNKYSVNGVIETGHGNTLFYESMLGMMFRSDYHYYMSRLTELNECISNAVAAERGIKTNGPAHYISMMQYEDAQGLRQTEHCQHYGWYDGSLIRVAITWEKADNGEPIGIISHKTMYGVRPEYMFTHGYS